MAQRLQRVLHTDVFLPLQILKHTIHDLIRYISNVVVVFFNLVCELLGSQQFSSNFLSFLVLLSYC